MRPVAVLAAILALAVAGCGGASRTAAIGASGQDAAALVPAGALAFVSADTRLDSGQWQKVEDLTGAVTMLRKSLGGKQIDLDRDVRPALGDHVSLALLGVDNGKPEAIALAQPKDEAKLRALAAKFDHGSEHYTVEQIGGWSVVADSQSAFDAVRAAESGRSLADTAHFKAAMDQLGSGALAIAYTDGAALPKLPAQLRALVRVGGSPQWVAARVAAEGDAVRVDAHAGSPSNPPAVYAPTLLKDVPSGAIAAISFKNVNTLLSRVAAEPALRTSIAKLEAAAGIRLADLRPLNGEGVLYVAPGALIPVLTLELKPSNPAAAAKTLRAISTRASKMLPLRVERRGAKVLLTTASGGLRSGGASLVDDQPYKDALAAAAVPHDVTWLAYADIQRLAPILQAVAALTGGGQAQAGKESSKLDKLRTVVAFGARSGSSSRLSLRLTLR